MTITDESTVSRLRQHAAMPSQFLGDDIYAEVVRLCDSHEQLSQQLAEVTAEIGGLRHDLETAHAHRRIAEQDSDRLRAVLAAVAATKEPRP